MDAEYLKANVGEVLANGLTAVVLNQPEDSVDYLARWLLKYVDNTKAEQALKLDLAKQNEIDKKQEEEDAAAKAAAEKTKASAESSAASKKQELEDFLSNAAAFDGLYQDFIQHLHEITGVTGVYMGLKETDALPPEPKSAEEGDEGDEAPTSNLSLQYIAANKDHSFLIGQRLRGTQGNTFDVFKDEAAAEGGDEGDEAGDEGDEGAKVVEEKKDEGPKTVHIPNVLMGPNSEKSHFWQLPKLGSYLTLRMNYDACLNETTLDEAIEKEASLLEQKAKEEEEAKAAAEAAAAEGAGDEGDAPAGGDEGDEGDAKEVKTEDAKEEPEEPKEETEEEREARELAEAAAKQAAEELYLVTHLPKKSLDYAICLDTLGQNRRFAEEEIAYIKKMVSQLNETVVRIDRQLFKEERIRRAALVEYNESVEEKTEDEKKQEMDRLKSSLERAGTSSTTEADVAFKYRQNNVMGLREKLVEFRQFNVFRGPLDIMQALFFMLDYLKTDVSDLDGKPDWNKIRANLDDDFFNKLQAYDPRDQQIRKKDQQHATVANLRKMIAPFTDEDVKAKNVVLCEIMGYVRDALAVKKQARQERKEARLAAEAEAAALAAEQAAAAAAGGDEGDAAEAAAEE